MQQAQLTIVGTGRIRRRPILVCQTAEKSNLSQDLG
jgi:hypothetical protein